MGYVKHTWVNGAPPPISADNLNEMEEGIYNAHNGPIDKLIITDGAGHFAQFPKLTTAERDALTPVNGMLIYNSTTLQFEKYEDGSWKNLGSGKRVIIEDGAGNYLQIPKLTTAERDVLTPIDGMMIYNSTLGQFECRDDSVWISPGVPTKEVFFPAETANNIGDFRTKTLGLGSAFQFNFKVPHDFTTLVTVEIVFISSGTSGTQDIDIYSDFAALGEPYNQHEDSVVGGAYDLGSLNNINSIDLASVLDISPLAAGDYVGILIDHQGIGGNLDYLGIRLRYT